MLSKVKLINVILCCWMGIYTTSCSITKHLNEDDKVLKNVKLQLDTDKKFSNKRILEDRLYLLSKQKPNTYFLGMPYKVWLYNLRYQQYQTDSLNFQIRNKVVEQPVVFDSASAQESVRNIKDYLINRGYFYSDVNFSVKYKRKKYAKLKYAIKTGNGYYINNVDYTADSALISAEFSKIINEIRKNSLLQKRSQYSHTVIGEERLRIVTEMRNKGYYNFGTNNLTFILDTLQSSIKLDDIDSSNLDEQSLAFFKKKKININTLIHPSKDSMAFKQFTFGSVTVYPDYLEENLAYSEVNTITSKQSNIVFKFHNRFINTGILEKKIFIKPGNVYSEDAYNQTIRQINDLGNFQYVRVLIEPVIIDGVPTTTLDCKILMGASPRYDFSTNVEISGGDLYVLGTAANVSITDKNFLKGANQLTATTSYGLELGQNKQLEGENFFKQLYLFSQNTGLNFRFTSPKFILPINQNKFSASAMPNTVVDAGINNLIRQGYFSLRSINAAWGYTWKETATKRWTVRPVFVNMLKLSNVSASFKERMDSIPAIGNSYQETFIEGENVEFIYNTQGKSRYKYSWVKLGIEEAGAIMNGINGLNTIVGGKGDLNFAEYLRLDFDARQYFHLRKTSFAFRFYGGVGMPYGQSPVLPYIKQYFVGGAYSIRGWRPRVLGPGSFYDESSQQSVDNLFIDQAGDIKLELNAEYRFPLLVLFSGAVSINGAFFVDAGNIWLAKKDHRLEGAEFKIGNLYQEIAVSYGTGLRFDLGGFLVLRLDGAVQAKKPYIFNGNGGWTINQTNFSSAHWRRQNTNINIAIGYPF